MELAVNQFNLKIDQRVPGDCTTRRRILDAFFDCRPPLLGNRAAENLIDKFKTAAARQRLKDAGRFAKLAAPTGLFLVTANDLSAASEGFKISDLRRVERHFDTIPFL